MIELSNELEQKIYNLEKEKKELEQKIVIIESDNINNELRRLVNYYKKYKELEKKFKFEESEESEEEESEEEPDEEKKYMEELIKRYNFDDTRKKDDIKDDIKDFNFNDKKIRF